MSKDLITIITGRVLQIVIMLAAMRLLTSLLTPHEVGNYYIAVSVLAFFNLVLLNPAGMYFSRHLLQWNSSEDLSNALFVFFVWMIIIALVSIPISVAIYYIFDYQNKFNLNLFLIYIVLSIIIGTLHRNALYGSNTLGYRRAFVIYLIITLCIGLVISVIIVNYHHYALGWLLGVVFSELIVLYWVCMFFVHKNRLDIRRIKKTLSIKRLKRIFIFSFPIGITTLFMWGQSTSYRFIVDHYYSSEILGYIAIGLWVASAVFSSVESISMQYFYPLFLKNILNASKAERAKAWNDIAKQLVPIYILVAFYCIAMSEVLINVLVDDKFHGSYIYTMIGVGIEFFRVMINLLYNVSQSEHKTTYTIMPYFLGCVVTIGVIINVNFNMNYFMIPLVMAFSYLLVFIYMYINMKKLLEIKYDIKILKLTLLSTPFFIVYLIDIQNLNIYLSLLVILVFGLYLLWNIILINDHKIIEKTQ